MGRLAYFGGTFDPVHNGHLAIARALVDKFDLTQFIFLPAFHAPHKPDRVPTSAYHRFAMLCIATEGDPRISVSTLELDKREKRYTIDTVQELHARHPDDDVFFVMGADSWADIRTWREWEDVLLDVNHIVITRPGFPISIDHVTERVRSRVVDLRTGGVAPDNDGKLDHRIYITDTVEYDISATGLRNDLADGELALKTGLPIEVANYIEKYELYT